MNSNFRVLFLALLVFSPLHARAQSKTADESSMPAVHRHGVMQRGDKVMGFSHDKTTHHFLLYPDGGAIKVTANDPNDNESRDLIRMHLSHIASMFAAGNFNAPMLIHGRVPPCVTALKSRKDKIAYQFSDVERGGLLRITTQDGKALKAVHEFLRFQISDHQTGDSTKVGEGVQ